jgi:hypothetical protein
MDGLVEDRREPDAKTLVPLDMDTGRSREWSTGSSSGS